jgi:phage baseplate assembly protein W
MAITYKGFSTQAGNRNFRLTDFDLIKQDILNHFNIRKGEKLMRPNFGTIIWNVLHEPFTEDLKSVIAQDVKAIASYDPRVSFDNIIITEFDQGIQIELQLRYVLTNQTNVMLMNFNGTTLDKYYIIGKKHGNHHETD